MLSPVADGELLAGKYAIEGELGAGGMGVVVSARHVQLDQPVAIKLMHREATRDADAIERFMREGRAAVRLRGENVAHVMDVGVREDGTPYLVMEYLDGLDLATLLERDGPLTVESAVTYVLQACVAMAEAHTQGIIHRDLKPQNLFLTKRDDDTPLVKVLDFGISKIAPLPSESDDAHAQVITATVMGSPAYISPEQASSSRDVDARTDIWSLGVILYQLLCAKLPFAADSVPQVFAKIYYEPPDPLRVHESAVPIELEAVVMGCLAKDPDERYESVSALAEALLPFVSERPGKAAAKATMKLVNSATQERALRKRVRAFPPGSSAMRAVTLPPVETGVRTWRAIAIAGLLMSVGLAIALVLLLGRS